MPSKRKLVILYGSETGNAQDLAYIAARKCQYLRFETQVSSLDDFDLKKLLDVRALIVVCSTTGQGEVPRNGRKFWKFMLKKRLPGDLLNHLKFSTFGLGDSSYPKYNHAIKKIHARLLQLGASELSPRGEGDEQSPDGSEVFYAAWESLLLDNLRKWMPIPAPLTEIPASEILSPSNRVVIEKNKFKVNTELDSKQIALARDSKTKLTTVKVEQNKRVTADDHFQDVRNVVLADENGSLNYSPGDTVSLYASNDPKDVNALIEIQQWGEIADYPIKIEGDLPSIEGGLVKKLTLRSLFTHHLDIMSIPRRSFFMLAWHFASDELEKEKLREFSLIEETEQLYDYANRPRRSILEVIQEFFSLKIPIEYIFDVFPVMKPRLFSISSKPDASLVELTVAIVEYKTIIRRVRRGVCTRWLKTLEEGDQIVISINRNHMNFGMETNDPIIMVAPGTGVAPMKSLIQATVASNQDKELYLFFGSRFSDKDYLYGEIWEQLEKAGKLKVFTSFSREKGGYVQDKLYGEKELVNELILKRNALFYLCGSSGKMPIQVRITIESILGEMNGWDEEESKRFLMGLENGSRYLQETW